MTNNKQFYVRVDGQRVAVTEEVYLAYYRMKRHERHLREKDAAHGLIRYASLDTHQSTGEEELPDADAEDVAEIVTRRLMSEKLHKCLELLPDGERALINALFFENKTERQYSAETGIPQKTINDRKTRILAKLKKLLGS